MAKNTSYPSSLDSTSPTSGDASSSTLAPASSQASSSNPTATPDGERAPGAAHTGDREASAPAGAHTLATPNVSVQGGKVTISNFDHYHAHIGIGADAKAEAATKFAPGHAKVLTLEVNDHSHRLKLAALLEGVAQKLRG